MSVAIFPVHGIPEIAPGDDLVAALIGGLEASELLLRDRDVVVVTHKVVSKAEGRIESAPDDDAYRQLAERESRAVLRRRGDLIIAQTEHGFICANAGVDAALVRFRGAAPELLATLCQPYPDELAKRLEQLVKTGRDHWQQLGEQMLNLYQQHGEGCAPRLESLIENNYL